MMSQTHIKIASNSQKLCLPPLPPAPSLSLKMPMPDGCTCTCATSCHLNNDPNMPKKWLCAHKNACPPPVSLSFLEWWSSLAISCTMYNHLDARILMIYYLKEIVGILLWGDA